MTRRKTLILSFAALAGLMLAGLFISVIASSTPRRAPAPPELGGQKVPAKRYEIRFDQKYDLFCSFYESERTIEQASSQAK
jgi:hypothetical protein